ncbi:TPA: hypothetical protein EYG84_01825 [Candidatus Gracilibacteria bacterium]|nr:hypothetical protein [Candidatus Gracilibacteria bacterium]
MMSVIASNITPVIKKVLLGLLLFLISFFVLFWNEGDANISEIAETSIEVQNIANIDKNALHKKFVSITGALETNQQLEDIFLKKNYYIQINRIVETYKVNTRKNNKEDQKKIITHEWVQNIENKNEGKDYHRDKKLQSITQTTNFIALSGYKISIDEIELPATEPLILTQENTIQTNNTILLNQKYLFKGYGSLQQPKIGDIRISYTVINAPSQLVTLFGKIDTINNIITPYYYNDNKKIYKIFNKTREESIIELKKEDIAASWIIRILGFSLMWTGLLFIATPLFLFISVIPFIGKFGTIGIILLTGLISIILSTITIFISIILHNIIILVIVIVLIITGLFFYIRNTDDKSHKKLIT